MFLEPAETELEKAISYYETEQQGLGVRLDSVFALVWSVFIFSAEKHEATSTTNTMEVLCRFDGELEFTGPGISTSYIYS